MLYFDSPYYHSLTDNQLIKLTPIMDELEYYDICSGEERFVDYYGVDKLESILNEYDSQNKFAKVGGKVDLVQLPADVWDYLGY